MGDREKSLLLHQLLLLFPTKIILGFQDHFYAKTPYFKTLHFVCVYMESTSNWFYLILVVASEEALYCSV